MTVLVTAASKHGATSEIAARIGAVLTERGVQVDVKKPEEVGDLAGYEAVVAGSGIYIGKWLKTARRFVDDHQGELAGLPTWLFSSGPIPGESSRPPDPQDAAEGDKLRELVRAREHKVFAGKLDKSELGFAEKAAVRMVHAGDGDHRDWHAIDEWAGAIAADLRQSGTTTADLAKPETAASRVT